VLVYRVTQDCKVFEDILEFRDWELLVYRELPVNAVIEDLLVFKVYKE
jgi:hypothetical protein